MPNSIRVDLLCSSTVHKESVEESFTLFSTEIHKKNAEIEVDQINEELDPKLPIIPEAFSFYIDFAHVVGELSITIFTALLIEWLKNSLRINPKEKEKEKEEGNKKVVIKIGENTLIEIHSYEEESNENLDKSINEALSKSISDTNSRQ